MAPPYSYPVAGIMYFFTHPQLWMKALCPFLLTLVFGIISLVLSFVYLLPLQAHALITAHCPVWLAWTVSVIFVLLESAIIDLIFFAIVMAFYQDILFDATLRARGLDRMFLNRVPVSGLRLFCRGISSGVALLWLIIIAQVVVLLVTLPLHLIPVVGTFLACYINGWVACWGHHLHYDLEFRGFSVSESRSFAWRHRDTYCSFGTVAVALELIPIFNLLFMWTNVVGAALWVGDKYEKNEREIARRSRSSSNEALLGSPYGAIYA